MHVAFLHDRNKSKGNNQIHEALGSFQVSQCQEFVPAKISRWMNQKTTPNSMETRKFQNRSRINGNKSWAQERDLYCTSMT